MSNTDSSHGSFDGLGRWLLGGLLGGAVILGLLIAAYAVGYSRGKDHRTPSAQRPPVTTTKATTTTAATTTASTETTPTGGAVTPTPVLVARGKTLFNSDGCSGCHSFNGATGVGPALNGLAGTTVTLDNGETVTADDAYLERSITDPDAQIGKGFQKGIMSGAVANLGLVKKPDEVSALVAYIKSHK